VVMAAAPGTKFWRARMRLLMRSRRACTGQRRGTSTGISPGLKKRKNTQKRTDTKENTKRKKQNTVQMAQTAHTVHQVLEALYCMLEFTLTLAASACG